MMMMMMTMTMTHTFFTMTKYLLAWLALRPAKKTCIKTMGCDAYLRRILRCQREAASTPMGGGGGGGGGGGDAGAGPLTPRAPEVPGGACGTLGLEWGSLV